MDRMRNLLFTSLTIALLVTSCAKEEANDLVGTWKLIEAKFYGLEGGTSSVGTIDYSSFNITYSFTTNNKLIIDSDQHPDFTSGTFEYEFGYFPLGGSNDAEILLVKIDGSKWTYNNVGSTMILGKSYVDAGDYYFERK